MGIWNGKKELRKVFRRMLCTMLAILAVLGASGCTNSRSGGETEPQISAQTPVGTTAPEIIPETTEPVVMETTHPADTEPEPTQTMTADEMTEPVTEPVETRPASTEAPPTIPTDPDPTEPPVTKPAATKPAATEATKHVHKYSEKVVKPTCTRKGYTQYTCACGDSYKADYVAAAGHAYKTKTIKATCQTEGYTRHTCSVCGDSYTSDTTRTTEHNWGKWTQTIAPTTSSTGMKERTCASCGETEKETIPVLPMTDKERQAEVLRLVNAEREKAGLDPLTYYYAGQSAADTRAEEIAEYFSHTRPNGELCFTVLTEAGIAYWSAGENIAKGQGTPEEVVEDWMNSEGHRANILGDYTHIIVGVCGNCWVQLFIS